MSGPVTRQVRWFAVYMAIALGVIVVLHAIDAIFTRGAAIGVAAGSIAWHFAQRWENG